MSTIQKVAVLGSGVMGSGIAAAIANAGIPVVLLDIPAKEGGKNSLAEGGIAKQQKSTPPGFVHARAAKLVTAGNLEDDLKLLSECDLIIEAVVEKIEVKQEVYRKIDAHRKKGSIVSSNTSTLPLKSLVAGLPEAIAKDFVITHFFNPPRFMRLLEIVPGALDAGRLKTLTDFADRTLGKAVVVCKDTPGFLANRIGIFWLLLGLEQALRLNITVEEADAVMGKPLGIPKTGVFGLYDLIGIDLMPLIAKAMLATLSPQDAFRTHYQEFPLITKMIAEGYTGRKGKGGFTRIRKEGDQKIKETLDLTGAYRAQAAKTSLASVDEAKKGIAHLLNHPDLGGQYARAVMLPVLHYAASLIPEISEDISDVDTAMKTGFNWKFGPFEMIDKIGVDAFAEMLAKDGLSIPPLIEKARGKTLYHTEEGARRAFSITGAYTPILVPEGTLMLADIKRTKKPILKNASASVWDLGDGIACLELTSKMNSVDPEILAMIEQAIELVKKDFKGLVIGNDADNFSVGANLGFMLMAANLAAWTQISDVIRAGQHAMMGLKYSPFPVVSALTGMALGGGCEIVLHSNAVQAHAESYPGLVEVGVGLIPGWGGCKEMLLRHLGEKAHKEKTGFIGSMMAAGGAMPAISKAFELIATAKVAGSAEEARDFKILRETDHITMNRARVLADAKARCLEMSKDYAPPASPTLHLPGGTAKVALSMALEGFKAAGKATPHDVVVCKVLANVLSGGDTDITDTLTEQQLLDLEHQGFMEVVKSKATLARIEHMLNTGKPLRN